ncbi:hypothetical protein C8R45DRAFT_1041658, partial [Mycena sanguinolenta]
LWSHSRYFFLPSFTFSLHSKMFRSSASFALALFATSVLTAGAAPVPMKARALDLATICNDLSNVQGITNDITTGLTAIAGIAGSGTSGLAGVLNTFEGIVNKVSTVEQTLTAACAALTGGSTDTAAAAASTDTAAAAASTDTAAAADSTDSAAVADSTDSAAVADSTDSAAVADSTDSAAVAAITGTAAAVKAGSKAAAKATTA